MAKKNRKKRSKDGGKRGPDRDRRPKGAGGGAGRGRAPGAQVRIPLRDRTLTLGFCLATVLLLSLAFPPLRWTPLAHVALVPMLVAIARPPNKRVLGASTALAATVFYSAQMYWLIMHTWPGYIGVVIFCSLFWPAFALVTSYLLRRTALPLALLAPLVWVPLELLRAYLLTGFPWLMLGHAQAASTTVVQIADLTGVYGLSALSAATAGMAVDLITRPLFLRYGQRVRLAKTIKISAVVLAALWVLVIGYGRYRLRPVEMSDGPLVVTVQPNVPQVVRQAQDREEKEKDEPPPETREEIEAQLLADPAFADLMEQTPLALAQHPDAELVVWPETMAPVPINRAVLVVDPEDLTEEAQALQKKMRTCWRMIHRLVAGSKRRLLVGAVAKEDDETGRFNSEFNRALLFGPDDAEFATEAQYDKVHLVPFGEYVPFRESWPGLYRLLLGFTPYDYEYNLTAGQRFTRMEVGGRRFAVPICFEDAFGRVCREMVYGGGGKGADFLVNISNDGWFDGTVELQQHWDLSVFRAVENRVPVVRSVNTGISGFIDSCGRTVSRVSNAAGHVRSVAGFAAHRLKIDPRESFYGRWGDIFAYILSLALVMTIIVATFNLKSRRHSDE